jgi:hypothetical protein
MWLSRMVGSMQLPLQSRVRTIMKLRTALQCTRSINSHRGQNMEQPHTALNATLMTASFRVRAALLASNFSAVFCSLSLSFFASKRAASRRETFSLRALSRNDPRTRSISEDFSLSYRWKYEKCTVIRCVRYWSDDRG